MFISLPVPESSTSSLSLDSCLFLCYSDLREFVLDWQGLRTLGILNLGGIVRGDVSPRVRPNIQPLRLAKVRCSFYCFAIATSTVPAPVTIGRRCCWR